VHGFAVRETHQGQARTGFSPKHAKRLEGAEVPQLAAQQAIE
jgi:hypothetical protein